MILVASPHAADALTPVDIEDPHRYAIGAGNAGEKAREWLGGIVVGDDKLASVSQAVS
jgi:hypothetical protein